MAILGRHVHWIIQMKLNNYKQKLSLLLFGFYCVCNNQNNSQKDVDQGFINVDLYFTPKGLKYYGNVKRYNYKLKVI